LTAIEQMSNFLRNNRLKTRMSKAVLCKRASATDGINQHVEPKSAQYLISCTQFKKPRFFHSLGHACDTYVCTYIYTSKVSIGKISMFFKCYHSIPWRESISRPLNFSVAGRGDTSRKVHGIHLYISNCTPINRRRDMPRDIIKAANGQAQYTIKHLQEPFYIMEVSR
jgi:hypothetical protein